MLRQYPSQRKEGEPINRKMRLVPDGYRHPVRDESAIAERQLAIGEKLASLSPRQCRGSENLFGIKRIPVPVRMVEKGKRDYSISLDKHV